MSIGPLLVRTVRHFFPDFDAWIRDLPDSRLQTRLIYDKRFLLWWGLALFLCKLGSRRQLDYQLNTDGPEVLGNLNRLAGTQQTTRPVNKTLEHYVGRCGSAALAQLEQKLVQRLIRMKALDGARLQGRFLVLIDGTGFLVFRQPHCPHCLTRQHGQTTLYLHQVLEAKLLGPSGTVFSLATEFIDNRDAQDSSAGASPEQLKQDCELKALPRLLARIRARFPQLRLCLVGDSLFACGAGLQAARDSHCDFIYVFKEGRTPALWRDFQGLLQLCPRQQVEFTTPRRVRQVYRWVNDLDYQDSEQRSWRLQGLTCEDHPPSGKPTQWAWLTSLQVKRETVVEVAQQGGRQRWREENEGFNTQKNSGLNLEHAYSHKHWAEYYYLLQIAHLLLQLLEKGSLLRQLAQQAGKRTAVALFGSLKNLAQRLLESLRYRPWEESAFDRESAAHMQIRLDSG